MRTCYWIAASRVALATVASVFMGGTAHCASASATASAATVAASFYVLPVTDIAQINVGEISGLAWDADEQLLYAVSDQGKVYHFRIRHDGQAIVSIQGVVAALLVDPETAEGQPQSGKRFNAEGLTVLHSSNGKRGDSELVVALEENPPQIARFSPPGSLLGKLPVPPPANVRANYRKKNRGLESVAMHPAYGVITAPEAPLQGRPDALHTVYANGHAWSFARFTQDSRLKGIEVLPDGNLLVLERSRSGNAKGAWVASLRRVDIAGCDAPATCNAVLLAALPAGPENFEALTLLGAHHALIASDNGGAAAASRTTFALIVLP